MLHILVKMAGRLGGMMPNAPIILLREDTDVSQGTSQLLHNIGACSSIVSCVASTLGPRGMDKLIVDTNVSLSFFLYLV